MKFILILGIIVSILLILVVLIQNPKGGGIAANFSSGNQILGVKRTNAFVEKVTWILAGALLVLALVSTMTSTTGTQETTKSKMQMEMEKGNIQDNAIPTTPLDNQGGQDMGMPEEPAQ